VAYVTSLPEGTDWVTYLGVLQTGTSPTGDYYFLEDPYIITDRITRFYGIIHLPTKNISALFENPVESTPVPNVYEEQTMSTAPATVTLPIVDEASPFAPLTARDRCDSCGAQAYYRVMLAAGELSFCGHHYTKNATALKPLVIFLQDDSHRLTEE
jgi:hypothetical protein